MSKLTVQITAFKPFARNTLRGFATVRIPELKLTIRDVAVHEHSSGSRWAQLPGKPMLNPDGTAKRGDGGKVEYVPVMEFDGRAVREAFSAAVVRALLEFDPEAFNAEESAA